MKQKKPADVIRLIIGLILNVRTLIINGFEACMFFAMLSMLFSANDIGSPQWLNFAITCLIAVTFTIASIYLSVKLFKNLATEESNLKLFLWNVGIFAATLLIAFLQLYTYEYKLTR